MLNNDQDCQLSSQARRDRLKGAVVRLSTDGKGRRVGKSYATLGLHRAALAKPQRRRGKMKDCHDLHQLERSLRRWFQR
jgi:hypothetical protein